MVRLVRYTTEVGPGADGVSPAEFAAKVAAVLADPRGWAKYGYAFRAAARPVAARDEAVLRFRLETGARAATLCGIPGFSCWRRQHGDIIVNLTNWMGGSRSSLPLDRYRTYVIVHECGHALGLEHQGCPAEECARRGVAPCPASVMMQATRGPGHVWPCVENEWPLGPDWRLDDPGRAPGAPVPSAAFALAVIAVLVLCLVAVLAMHLAAKGRGATPRDQRLSRAG